MGLLLLVEIGRLENGLPIYLPQPEAQLLSRDADQAAAEAAIKYGVQAQPVAEAFYSQWCAVIVEDHQRVFNGIMGDEARLLPGPTAAVREQLEKTPACAPGRRALP